VYCVWQVVKTPTIISNNPVYNILTNILSSFTLKKINRQLLIVAVWIETQDNANITYNGKHENMLFFRVGDSGCSVIAIISQMPHIHIAKHLNRQARTVIILPHTSPESTVSLRTIHIGKIKFKFVHHLRNYKNFRNFDLLLDNFKFRIYLHRCTLHFLESFNQHTN